MFELPEYETMELKDTVEMMLSNDFRERFKAEYYQTRIRYEKLKRLLENWGNFGFSPVCPKRLLEHQLQKMYEYLYDLTVRAEKENIEL